MGNHTYKIPNGTREEIMQALLNQKFEFDSSWHYNYKSKFCPCLEEYNDSRQENLEEKEPGVFIIEHLLYKNRLRGYNFSSFEKMLDFIIRKMHDPDICNIILPSLKNLANLGFAPDLDYTKFTSYELREKYRIAKGKQQQYIENVSFLTKQMKEKNDILTEEGSLL